MSLPTVTQPWKLVLIGLTAGTVGGTFGVGGGIIIVPLLLVVGFDQHRAHATSLSAIVIIVTTGAISFGASGEINAGLGIVVGVGGVIGSLIGATLMNRVSARTLTIVFSTFLLIAAIRMISGADPIPGAGELSDLSATLIAGWIGLLAGFFAGLVGIGGGVVIVTLTVLLLGLTQHEAQGTSFTAMIFTSVAGTVVNLKNRRVRPKDGLAVGAGGAAGAVIGSQFALGVEGVTLSLAFGFLVLFVALRSFWRTFKSKPA